MQQKQEIVHFSMKRERKKREKSSIFTYAQF